MSFLPCRPCCRTALSFCQPQASTSYLPSIRQFAAKAPRGGANAKSNLPDRSDSVHAGSVEDGGTQMSEKLAEIMKRAPIGGTLSSGQNDGLGEEEPKVEATSMSNINARPVVQDKPRIFKPGELYAPYDLSRANLHPAPRPAAKRPLLGPSAKDSRRSDPFHILGVNPIDEACNGNLVRGYITQMGKIKSRAETGLTWKNQRRMGKMVRRARAMGIVSQWTNRGETEAN